MVRQQPVTPFDRLPGARDFLIHHREGDPKISGRAMSHKRSVRNQRETACAYELQPNPFHVGARSQHQVEFHLALIASAYDIDGGIYFPIPDTFIGGQAEAPPFRIISKQIVDPARQLGSRDSSDFLRSGELQGYRDSVASQRLDPDSRITLLQGDCVPIPASHEPSPRVHPLALEGKGKFGV